MLNNNSRTMSNTGEALQMLTFILNHKQADPVLKFIRSKIDTAGIVYQGTGSRPGKLLRLLGLDEVHRDILILIKTEKQVQEILASVSKEFQMNKPGHGIAFVVPIQYAHAHDTSSGEIKYTRKNDEIDTEIEYAALCCIVDHGLGVEAVSVAEEAGATGATFIQAKGSTEYSSQIFDFSLNPQKDFILMILKREMLENVENALDKHFSMENENSGIQFSYPITQVCGLYNEEA